jgi:hypothetical protein
MVTLDAFEKFLKWFGPVQGPEILDQVKSLLEEKWFHGELNAKEAEAKIVSGKRGAYLIRFSSAGGYSITFIDKKKKILHYRIPDNQKYDLQKFVKIFSKQHHLNAPVSPRVYDRKYCQLHRITDRIYLLFPPSFTEYRTNVVYSFIRQEGR